MAFDRVTAVGAVVTGVIPMVDRGDVAAKRFAAAQRAVRRAGHLPGPRHRAGQGRREPSDRIVSIRRQAVKTPSRVVPSRRAPAHGGVMTLLDHLPSLHQRRRAPNRPGDLAVDGRRRRPGPPLRRRCGADRHRRRVPHPDIRSRRNRLPAPAAALPRRTAAASKSCYAAKSLLTHRRRALGRRGGRGHRRQLRRRAGDRAGGRCRSGAHRHARQREVGRRTARRRRGRRRPHRRRLAHGDRLSGVRGAHGRNGC